ncbi:MAG TPA: TauD/TfdA family dioxygenase [Candidatus Udaeobacter sp.]|nr:TauD/TfdA family dioxygenase [Candidatus Udaeobacter sp.]
MASAFASLPDPIKELPIRMTPLHPRFGVEIHDVDLRGVTARDGYPAIRQAFESHTLLLFRDQRLDDDAHLALGALFGPIEDRSQGANGPKPAMSQVSNRRDDMTLAPADDDHTLNLMANQLWHTDSTFLPAPALANILAIRVVSSRGGETEFASTRAAWQDMPEGLKARARHAVLRHRYAHSRAKISARLATQELFTKWSDQAWKAVWRNPVTGEDGLYVASHAFAVDGLAEAEGQALIDELIAFATRPGTVYCHDWRPGDVLIWDERAMLHRGRPWPYEEERTLASICITARDVDGLDRMRP